MLERGSSSAPPQCGVTHCVWDHRDYSSTDCHSSTSHKSYPKIPFLYIDDLLIMNESHPAAWYAEKTQLHLVIA